MYRHEHVIPGHHVLTRPPARGRTGRSISPVRMSGCRPSSRHPARRQAPPRFRGRVTRSRREMRQLADDMLDTMYDAPGVGLAAIQIGVPKRIVTMDIVEDRGGAAAAGADQPGDPLDLRGEARLRGGLPLHSRNITRRWSARTRVRFRYPDLEGETVEHGGRRPPGDLRPARDRPPQRRALHRLPVEAEARPGGEEIQKAARARAAGSASPSTGVMRALVFMGTPDFAVPDAGRDRRAGARGRSRSIPARRQPPDAAWSCNPRRCIAWRIASAFRSYAEDRCGPRTRPRPSAISAPMSPWSSPTG